MNQTIAFNDIKPGDAFSIGSLDWYVVNICLSRHKTGLKCLRVENSYPSEITFLKKSEWSKDKTWFKVDITKSNFKLVSA
jgi:hypothetical protein